MSNSTLSPAVLECWTAYQQKYAIECGKGAREDDAYLDAKMAYRMAIPCLTDKASMRDFVACVTHGLVLGLIPNEDVGKLLYAANVAAGMLQNEQKAESSAPSQAEPKPVQKAQPQAEPSPELKAQPQAA